MSEMTFGRRVQVAREAQGLTQVDFAEMVGIDVRTLRRYEAGVRMPHMTLSLRIAEMLGIQDFRQLTGQPFSISGVTAIHPCVEPISHALGVRAALLPSPDALPDLAELAGRMERAWDHAQQAGPYRFAHAGALLPDLIVDAEVAYRAHRDLPSAAEARRVLVMVHLLARPLLKWLGHQDLALIPAERAMAIAEQGDDAGAIGAAAWNLAQAYSTLRQPRTSQNIAVSALELLVPEAARENSPRHIVAAAGALHLIAAVGASRDDNQDEAKRLLHGAAGLAARIGNDTGNEWRLAFGPTNIEMHQVSLAGEWGRTRLAIGQAAHMNPDASPSVERRVAIRLDLAAANSAAGENTAAVAQLLDANRLSPEQVLYSVTARMITAEQLSQASKSGRRQIMPLARKLGLVA